LQENQKKFAIGNGLYRRPCQWNQSQRHPPLLNYILLIGPGISHPQHSNHTSSQDHHDLTDSHKIDCNNDQPKQDQLIVFGCLLPQFENSAQDDNQYGRFDTVEEWLHDRNVPILYVHPGKYSGNQDSRTDKTYTGYDHSRPSGSFMTAMHGHFGRIGTRDQIGGSHKIQEVLTTHPFPASHYFFLHHCDMSRRPAKSYKAQLQEEFRDFNEFLFHRLKTVYL